MRILWILCCRDFVLSTASSSTCHATMRSLQVTERISVVHPADDNDADSTASACSYQQQNRVLPADPTGGLLELTSEVDARGLLFGGNLAMPTSTFGAVQPHVMLGFAKQVRARILPLACQPCLSNVSSSYYVLGSIFTSAGLVYTSSQPRSISWGRWLPIAIDQTVYNRSPVFHYSADCRCEHLRSVWICLHSNKRCSKTERGFDGHRPSSRPGNVFGH